MQPERSTYIGGGDIGAIAGVSPHKSAIDVYLQKLGLAPDEPMNEAMEWGLRLERPIAEKWAEERKVKLVKGEWIRGPQPWIGGTPDFLAEGHRLGMDSKTAGFFARDEWGDDGSDEIPDSYILQAQFYMGLTGFNRWDIAVLIAGQGFRIYPLEADRELQGSLFELADRFWREHIVKQVPPAADGSEAAKEALSRLYPRNTKPLLKSTPLVDEIAERLRVAREQRLAAEASEREASNQLKEIIADAEGIEGAWGRITWRATSKGVRRFVPTFTNSEA